MIACESFESVLDRAKPGDLVYFDPPYDPLSATASFVRYQGKGFSRADQERLRDVCLELTNRRVHVMLSNSATAYIRTLYHLEVFTIVQVRAGRAINSKATRRGKLTELLVVNDPVDHVIQLEHSCGKQASCHLAIQVD